MSNVCQLDLENSCTGCAACYNVCPVDAIKMKLNGEGFFFPTINALRCIDCGHCEKVCDLTNTTKRNISTNVKQYSIKASDEIRKGSSSGGAFYQLAQWILQQGGVVYGAAFDERRGKVCHVSTEQFSLQKLMRSKYVQSEIGETYKRAQQNLDAGKAVLFSGTPCQISALRNYLNKDFLKLLTVDFVCHGVPSTGFFIDMLRVYEKHEQSKIINITFREKDLGWRTQIIKFYFKNGKIIQKTSRYYYYLFLHNITLRKSCYECLRPEAHVSDITLMDFWATQEDDNKGISAARINTENGETIFQKINDFFDWKELKDDEITTRDFVAHDKLRSYTNCKNTRRSFFSYYKRHGFEKTLDNWFVKYYKRSEIFSGLCKTIVSIRELIRGHKG